MTRIFHLFLVLKIDPMSACDIRPVFTLPTRDSTLQCKRCVHLWNSFPCIVTLLYSLYLTYNFGPNALKHVVAMNKPPKLRSASSHYLKILGKVKVTLLLGTYEFSIHVIVYEEKRNVLLLGSDAFYNRLIYDRGKYLAFADKRHKPIPIHYELTPGAIKSIIYHFDSKRCKNQIKNKGCQAKVWWLCFLSHWHALNLGTTKTELYLRSIYSSNQLHFFQFCKLPYYQNNLHLFPQWYSQKLFPL